MTTPTKPMRTVRSKAFTREPTAPQHAAGADAGTDAGTDAGADHAAVDAAVDGAVLVQHLALPHSRTHAPAHSRTHALTHSRTRAPGPLIARIALLALIAALPAAFSAWIDPARLIAPRDAEHQMARVLVGGQNVTDYTNYDDRAIERELSDLRTEQAGVIALGSSRVQTLSAAAYPTEPFVNAGLAAGDLDDMMGAYALYDMDGRRPVRVVINVDPWTERASDQPAWGSLLGPRARLMRRAGLREWGVKDRVVVALSTVRRLASPEYFRWSAFSLRAHGPSGIQWKATERAENAQKTRLPDGTVVWPATPARDGARLAEAYARGGLGADARWEGLGHFLKRDPRRLERFVAYVRSTGVEVTLLLQPYSPAVYEAMQRLPGRPLAVVESRTRAMARETGSTVVGGYDPRPLGVGAADFYDASHMRPESLTRLVSGTR